MKLISHLFCMVTLFCTAMSPSTTNGQQWEAVIDHLTDQTLLVASVKNDAQLGRWLNVMDLPFAMDAQDFGDGEMTILLSPVEIRLVLSDPSGERQNTFKTRSVERAPWSVSHTGGTTVLARQLMNGPVTGQPLNDVDKQRWQDVLAIRGSDSLFVATAPASETRRVLAELALGFPTSEEIPNAANLIQEIEWMAMAFNQQDPVKLKLALKANDNVDANELATKLEYAASRLEPASGEPGLLLELFKLLFSSKHAVGNDLIVYETKGEEVADINQFAEKLLRQQESRSTVHSVREILLAMHNFESAYKHYPGPEIGQGESKGLSWRVAILPYLEQQALYNQFHLDEPWDSEHNKTLISKMPRIFQHISSKKQASEGLSNFVAPTGKGLAFESGAELKLGDFKDGSSNTILVMAVDDEHAEIWTKPVDQNFDPKNPRAGLLLSPMNEFLFGNCDGSVDLRKNTLSDDALRAWMTRAGGEVLQRDK